MSHATLEADPVAYGTDLAAQVLAYHQRAHTSEYISTCVEEMCRTAQQVAEFDSLLGVDA